MGERCASTCPRVSSPSSRSCGNGSAILLNELAAQGKNHVLDAASIACYIHVGDALFISSGNSGHNKAVLAMQQATDDMEDLGFNVNVITD